MFAIDKIKLAEWKGHPKYLPLKEIKEAKAKKIYI